MTIVVGRLAVRVLRLKEHTSPMRVVRPSDGVLWNVSWVKTTPQEGFGHNGKSDEWVQISLLELEGIRV